MPFTYRFRSDAPSPVDHDLASPNQESFNDDSIVLSDLVRAGETSRLRRRGAMRIESAGTTSSRHHRWRSPIDPREPDDTTLGSSPGYTWTIVENRSQRAPRHLPMLEVSDDDLEDSDSDSGDEMVFSASLNRAISEQAGHLESSEAVSLRNNTSAEPASEKPSLENSSYSLVCGGPVDDTVFQGQTGPESVYSALASFMLPQNPSSHSSNSPGQSSHESSDTNGCGTVIHTRAFYRYRHHQPIWTASTPATVSVVPLERMYFNDICFKDKPSSKLIKQEPCGCLRIGIGCANCGNPLGFRLRPCKVLRNYISSRQSLRRRWSYTPSSSATNVDSQDFYLYTIFPGSTTSPGSPNLLTTQLTSQRRRERSRTRSYPLLPPPPLIRLMSDSETSDSDEEVVIGFRAPERSMAATLLGGHLTASPEPTVIRLSPNPSPPAHGRSLPALTVHPNDNEDDSELGQARASWANVVRGVEADAFSLGEHPEGSSFPHRPLTRFRSRRDALGLNPERELQLTPRTGQILGPSHTDIPSVLLERAAALPTPPELSELPESPHDSNDPEQSTPRPTVWDMLPPEDHPSTSFWGRPAPGDSQWTWSNEHTEERERGRNDTTRTRVLDPDGEFLEGLEGEWGEEMARRLGFSSTEEKSEPSEGGETPTQSRSGGLWWS